MKFKTLLVGACLWMGISAFGQHHTTDPLPGAEISEKNSVELFAPNAFTPDGNFTNNTWKIFIQGIDIYDFHLSVFNRSGRLVWESFNVDAEWDGYFGGNPAQEGLFIWTIEAKNAISDERHQFSGFITLLR